MYLPSDDSIFLSDCVKEYRGKSALDIGVGYGIITDTLCKNFEYVVGTDIDIDTLGKCKGNHVSCRQANSKISSHDNRFELICSDAASAFGVSIFDLIVSNLPYLPDDYDNEGKRIHDKAIYGGATGIEQTLHIIRSSMSSLRREGSFVTIVSSLSHLGRLYQLTNQLNLNIRKIAERNFFFETLSALELRF